MGPWTREYSGADFSFSEKRSVVLFKALVKAFFPRVRLNLHFKSKIRWKTCLLAQMALLIGIIFSLLTFGSQTNSAAKELESN